MTMTKTKAHAGGAAAAIGGPLGMLVISYLHQRGIYLGLTAETAILAVSGGIVGWLATYRAPANRVIPPA